MPIYEYECRSCGKTVDVLQKVSDPAPAVCSACGAPSSLERVVSRTSFVLKGGGWYKDLYGSTSKDGGSSGGSSSSGSGSTSSPSSDSSSSSTASSTPASTSSTPASPSSTPASTGSTKS